MTFTFPCPKCRRNLLLEPDFAGMTIGCPWCAYRFTAPSAEEAAAARDAEEKASPAARPSTPARPGFRERLRARVQANRDNPRTGERVYPGLPAALAPGLSLYAGISAVILLMAAPLATVPAPATAPDTPTPTVAIPPPLPPNHPANSPGRADPEAGAEALRDLGLDPVVAGTEPMSADALRRCRVFLKAFPESPRCRSVREAILLRWPEIGESDASVFGTVLDAADGLRDPEGGFNEDDAHRVRTALGAMGTRGRTNSPEGLPPQLRVRLAGFLAAVGDTRPLDMQTECEFLAAVACLAPAETDAEALAERFLACVRRLPAAALRSTQPDGGAFVDFLVLATAREAAKAAPEAAGPIPPYDVATRLAACGRDRDAARVLRQIVRVNPTARVAIRAVRKLRLLDPAEADRARKAAEAVAEARYRAGVQDLEARLTEESVAARLEIPWPPVQPNLTPREVEEEAAETVRQQVRERFPDETLAAIRREAEERYAPYRIGDTVSLRLEGGSRVNSLVSGVFRERYPGHVKIGDRVIPRSDFNPVDRARLDPVLAEAAARTYIEERTALFLKQRRNREREIAPEIIAAHYRKAGYVRYGNDWRVPAEVIGTFLREEHRRALATLRQEAEDAAYGNEGFVRQGDDWVPGDPDA